MSSNISYDYASGNLLENRNTYFYTKFQGHQFLFEWRKQRELARLKEEPKNEDALQTISSSTDRLLEQIWNELLVDDFDIHALELLNNLVQRFEVTKRLHDEYNGNWRPIDNKEYNYLDRYVKFVEVLDLAYTSTLSLPYLNALLKCMDTVSALYDQLHSSQILRFRKLVIREREHIEKLAYKN